jgi:hypothetical protein
MIFGTWPTHWLTPRWRVDPDTALAIAGADDRPRAIELTGAIARLFESAGLPVDSDLPGKKKQPGLSTGLSHQFVSNDRG